MFPNLPASVGRRRTPWPADAASAAVVALLVGAAAFATGPRVFDAVDGAELSLAGAGMQIAHPPGYPIFLMLLRLGGASSYAGHRVITSLIAAMAAAALYGAVRSFGLSRASSAGSALIVTMAPPVLWQLGLVEVHGLGLLLCSLAVLLRYSAAGGYMLGLAIFGGHPLAVCLLPILMAGGGNGRKWLVLAALPATLLLYVPLRAQGATLLHYTSPGTFSNWLHYMGLYGGRVSGPSAGGLGALANALGPVAAGAVAVLLLLGRPRGLRGPIAALIALLAIVFYDVRDLYAYWWLILLPLAPWLASGLERLRSAAGGSVVPHLAIAASVAAAGALESWRPADRAAETVARDMVRGAGIEGIYCTVGHQTFYAAYLLNADDLRPDLLPADLYGNLFGLGLFSPGARDLPARLGGRTIYATRAWHSLPLNGLLFTVDGPGLQWSSYDIFRLMPSTPDPLARDQLAECWMRRGHLSRGQEARRAFAKAESLASTPETQARIHALR